MEDEEEVTLLVDADSLIYFVAHIEDLQEAILKLDKRVSDMMVANNTSKYVMFLTGKDCFRYDVAKSAPYKGNRKDRERPKWLGVITQYMIAQYKAVYYKGLEADDCVTYFQNKIDNNRICAIDKDVIYSTPGSHFNYQMVKADRGMPQFKGLITVTEKEAQEAFLMQNLTGDSGDNIPGVKGVGPAKAKKILDSAKYSEEAILSCYVDMYGCVEGVTRFTETFRLVYMLRNDEDMMREVGYIPELPEIQTYEMPEKEEELDSWD